MVATSNFSFLIASSWDLSSLSSISLAEYEGERLLLRGLVLTFLSMRSFTEFGNDIFVTASVFSGSPFTSSDDICPRNMIDFNSVCHLFSFSFRPVLRNFKNSLFKRPLCSARLLPHTIMPSWKLALPGTSEAMEVTSHWITSLAE